MNSNRRKMKPADFKMFDEKGKFNFDWPMCYNFATGFAEIDYPKKELITTSRKASNNLKN